MTKKQKRSSRAGMLQRSQRRSQKRAGDALKEQKAIQQLHRMVMRMGRFS